MEISMQEIKGVADLNKYYNDALASHNALFSEQRSNILLVNGLHYARKDSAVYRNIRNSSSMSRDQKIRLVKNHIQRITKIYQSNLSTHAPGTQVDPKNPSEYHDQKVAEMHQSVWADMKKRNNYDRIKNLLIKDYVEIGEAWMKVFFDPNAGEFAGYEPKTDKEGNFFVVNGVPQADTKMSGQVIWERLLGFNVLTDPSARVWEECQWVVCQKMVPTANLKEQFKNDDKKKRYITESSKQTWMLFDSSQGSYRADSSGLTMVREMYARPCAEYEHGYYWIFCEEGILHQGELPHGLFPIVYVGFDEASTSARSFSIIKQIRPYQAEINRAASKIAEHQTTLGDDKIILQAGASISAGGTAHGVKAIKVNGPIQHLPGRSGDQFVGYMDGQIKEMYFVANVEEDSTDKPDGSVDPYSLLYRSMRDKKRYSIYAEKFEKFLVDWCELSLRYAKKDYSEDMIVAVVGKKEIVNIPEFKSSDDLSFEISVVKQAEDIESRFGRQLSMNHLLQYVGNSLKPEDVGQVVKNMPFVNNSEILSDLTLDYENILSDILAMDRGVFVPPNKDDNHQYVIRKLIHRMKQKDFQFLPEFVRSNYEIKKGQHEQVFAEQQRQAQLLSTGFIPSGGFLVKVDLRVPDPLNPGETKILKVPIESISWMLEKLEAQGQTQALLQGLEPSAQADVGMQVAASNFEGNLAS
jgi:hypothetical protein